MSAQRDQQAADRLEQALAAFQKAQGLILTAHRQLRGVNHEDADRFWAGTGAKLDQHLRACASALVAAYQAFSRAGGIAEPASRRLVNEAQAMTLQVGGKAS